MDMPPAMPAVRAPRILLLGLLILQTILLYLLTSGIVARLALNRGQAPFGSDSLSQLLLVGLPSMLTFILPSMLSALAPSWQSALALAVAPWWLVILVHAGTLLNATWTTLSQPAWLSVNTAVSLLISLTLFMLLGFLGWLARHTLTDMR